MSTWKKVITTGSSITDINDVDTTGVEVNDVLKFDGTNFVSVVEGTNLRFSHRTADIEINGHDTLAAPSSRYLIGSGVMSDADSTFTIKGKLENPPSTDNNAVDGGKVTVVGGSVDDDTIGYIMHDDTGVTLTSSMDTGFQNYTFTIDYSSNTNIDIHYPDLAGVTATQGAQISIHTEDMAIGNDVMSPATNAPTSAIWFYFANYVYIGKTSDAVADIDSEAEVEALSYKSITNDLGTTTTDSSKRWAAADHLVNCGTGERYIFAVPARLVTAANTLNFVDDDTGIGIDITDGPTVNLTNEKGYQEDYKVYGTTETGLGQLNIKTKR